MPQHIDRGQKSGIAWFAVPLNGGAVILVKANKNSHHANASPFLAAWTGRRSLVDAAFGRDLISAISALCNGSAPIPRAPRTMVLRQSVSVMK